ncbi:hypothetical protein EXW45_23845 [Bacillus wiedmannii]|uniref:PBECR4 domain-containing protein n=1 Tax=Bacillus cereus group TaxID=86661 RepID=UPI0011EDB545|nr:MULTISPECIES: PBECR4 domain-containing protein [Bacillus cereus group]KAA0795292.1 hypothetical protein DN394_00580 [Bacillus sp. BB081]QWH74214.1 hypothetical protein EXW45_23845 [Bacillus wiedmannii]
MITTTQDLYGLTTNPRINEISLELLCKFYEKYLNPYIFQYEIIDDSGEKPIASTIELRFDKENFCHLLAIEKIVERVKNKQEIEGFKGEEGWNNVKSGEITLSSLRGRPTKKKFDSNKDKYVFFYIIPKLVDKPKAVLYDKEKVRGNVTNIDCEILFHDQQQDATVHLGIKKDEDLGYYIPKTFFVERITETKDGLRFVGDQQKITVTKMPAKLI